LTRIAIVADDLTGALDTAAPFAGHGLLTRVAATPQAVERLEMPCEVVSVSTNSRHLPAESAAAAVAAACRALAPLAPAIWFKKIDSTLRGNVAVETVAALAASNRREIVITPATPAQGRTVRHGEVLVDGVPLAETEFVRDPVSPASPVPLADQLRAADPSLEAQVVTRRPPPAEGRCAWIADAASDDDLERVARWALTRAATALMAGAAGLGSALAECAFDGKVAPPRTGPLAGPILYVVGSRAAVSVCQADRLAAGNPDCVPLDAPRGRLDIEGAATALRGRRAGLVRVPSGDDGTSPEAVARALGESVAALIRQTTLGALLLTGGDTAAAVLAAIERPLVTLAGEVAPGVPLGHVEIGGRRVWLVTKAGGFGAEDLFLALPRMLGA
jgi:uncharacterized protein YgbK (DUF1537 family)